MGISSRPIRRVFGATLVALTALSLAACSSKEKSDYPDRCAQAPAPGIEWARCNLRGADLRNVDLTGALIHDVDLSGADLSGATLRDASVSNTEFTDANLRNADLTNTLFSGGDIHLAKFCKTTMPTGSIASADC